MIMADTQGGKESPEIPEEIAALTFEAALGELEDVVRRLESGDVDLEESLDLYARGTLLKAHCEAKLKAAREKVEKLLPSDDAGQEPASEPFDME